MIDTEQSFIKKSSRQLTLFQAVNALITSEDTAENILRDVLHTLLDTLGYAAAQIYKLGNGGGSMAVFRKRIEQ